LVGNVGFLDKLIYWGPIQTRSVFQAHLGFFSFLFFGLQHEKPKLAYTSPKIISQNYEVPTYGNKVRNKSFVLEKPKKGS